MEEQDNKNTAVIIGVVLLALVATFFLYRFLAPRPPVAISPHTSNGTTPPPQTTTPPPPTGTSTPPTGQARVNVRTKAGDYIPVKDFYPSAAETIRDSKGEIAAVLIKKIDLYEIVFIPFDNSFLLSLKSRDAEAARTAAEHEFLGVLNISQEQACALRVTVAVDKDANIFLAGRDYHLSFCPDGVPFVNP